MSACALLAMWPVAFILAGCMGMTVRSNFESDFRCPAASEVTDLGGDRYRVTGCGREAVYQCEREERGPICSLQLTADLEPEGESGLPPTEPVIARAKLVKDDAGQPTVSLDIRLDPSSLVTLRAKPNKAPDAVKFRLLHRPEKDLERCDFGFMLNDQLLEMPNVTAREKSAPPSPSGLGEGRCLVASRWLCHTPRMTRRINARIDPVLAGKLLELQQRTGKSTTEILQAAIEQYYDSMAGVSDPGRLFEGFVGCADGPRDLSSNYKAELTRSLKKKS